MRHKLRLYFLLTALWLGFLSLPMLLSSCGGSGDESGTSTAGGIKQSTVQSGPAPRLDSVYIIRAMQANARFKAQEKWARKFYRERQFRLGWFKDHQLLPQAQTMLTVISKAKDDGLDPKHYQDSNLPKLLAEFKTVQDSLRRNALERKIDVTLSGTYFNWASDYYRGVANPRDTKNEAWKVKRNKIKLDHALMTILRERESTYPYYDFAPQKSIGLAACSPASRWLAYPTSYYQPTPGPSFASRSVTAAAAAR
jgi:hypothetical protein